MAQVSRKAREGTVMSDKMDKTVVVAVSGSTRHRLYKKIMRRLRRYMVHDETNDAKLGDRVRIVESRPHSRRKRWQLAEVLVRADRPEVAAEEIDLELLGEVKVEEEEPEAEEPETAARAEPEEPAEAAEQPEPEAKETVEEVPEEEPEAEEPETEARAEPEELAEAAEEPEAEEQPEAVDEVEAEEAPGPAEAEEQTEPEAKEAPEAEGEEEEES